MIKSTGFTLVEVIITLIMVSALLAFSIAGASRYKNALEYNYSLNQVLSDIKLTQQIADSSHEVCRIEFKAGKNEYRIEKRGVIIKSAKVGSKIQFYGKSYFSFVSSGYTEVGGSGTLFLGGSPKVKGIVVSSKGRVRVEQ